MSAAQAPVAPRPAWMRSAEKGSVLGIRLLVWLATVTGRGPASWLLRPVATYYALLHGDVRRASRRWLEMATGRPASLGDVVGHIRHFAQVALDRLFFLRGISTPFRLSYTGDEHLHQLAAAGQGGILLGAHLGSQGAMGAGGYDQSLRINVVGYFNNAAMFNSALVALNPQSRTRLVNISPDSPGSVLDIRERVDRGELVALAGDRLGANDRVVYANFFGRPAPFPLAPFVLAAILNKPVCLVFALYREPDSYDLYCEPFAETLAVPRKGRQEALALHVQRYAERLEHYARLSPNNWFNFFDFHDPHGVAAAPEAAPEPPADDAASAGGP